MDINTFKNILATSASICTVLQFLSGSLVCRKYVANKSTGDASVLPFVTCFMSTSLWLRYGFFIDDTFIIIVNVFGATLQACYVYIFAVYSVKKSVVFRQFFIAFLFVLAIYFYCNHEQDKVLAAHRLGLISCSLTILFFASPLSILASVIRTKSCEHLPYPIILSTFAVSCQWFVYGYLLGDPFIQTPNLIGCVLSAFQLSLFLIYKGKSSDQIRLV